MATKKQIRDEDKATAMCNLRKASQVEANVTNPEDKPQRVIFRVDTRKEYASLGPTAVFLDEELAPREHMRMCYAHAGQHGSCSLWWVRSRTRPARLEEYATLQRELESIGYTLQVVPTLRGAL